MRYLRIAGLLAVCMLCASFANAQRVSVGVGFGGPVYAGYGFSSSRPFRRLPLSGSVLTRIWKDGQIIAKSDLDSQAESALNPTHFSTFFVHANPSFEGVLLFGV